VTALAWVDGRIVPADEPRILVGDRGLTLGDGLFETIRVSGGRAVGLDAHLARLAAGRAVIGLDGVPADEALARALRALIAEAAVEEGAARLTVTRGPGPRGLVPPVGARPTVVITAVPGAAPQGPVRLCVAHSTRRNEWSPLARIKSTNALDAILARREAAARGCDDAVMLNTKGNAAETTIANLFVRLGPLWVTPSVAEGALPGTMRARILGPLGAVERPVSCGELERADEIVLTSALSVRGVGTLVTASERALSVETARRLGDALGL
jgi:branched-chain amino acid aminotransferase